MPQDLTPDAVIAAAAEYADRHSFETVSLTAVARELRVPADELHRHVPDRATLLDGIQVTAMAELADRIEQRIAGTSGEVLVRRIADAFRDFGVEHPGRWRSLQRPISEQAADDPRTARLFEVLDAAMLTCGVPAADAPHASRMLIALVTGYIRLATAGVYDVRPPHAAETWERMIDIVDFVLRNWPAPPSATAPAVRSD